MTFKPTAGWYLVHTSGMSSGRSPKRARKKAGRDARRDAVRQAKRRRRRQRLILLATSLVLIGGGVLIVLFVRGGNDNRPQATPSDDPAIVAPTPEPVACGAELPSAAGSRKKTYPKPTDQKLDPEKTYTLRLETSCGDIEIELDVDGSPRTANSVAFLAREGFYDGLVFHRIVPDFVVQGGDPQGDGSGGPGYDVVEPPPEDVEYAEGTVAMAKGQNDPPGTSGSQFFVVSGPEAADLPAEYAFLGNVVDGKDVVEKIEALGKEGVAQPSAWAYIERANILEE
jgi:cyclophilin family peptidyl-prolyl cis-trans isomerase